VEVGKWPSVISAYKSIEVLDIVFQPGAVAPEELMSDDMVCHITAGEFKIEKGETAFNVKEGDVYTCGKGKPDKATNTGSVVGVHRVIILIPA
jgi:quercetin dioxygenase-like cupin family protein